jgi:hypothetical protein
MLILAFWILAVAVALGSVLAFVHLHGKRLPPWQASAVHGVLGAIGLGLLVIALGGPARGAAYGVSAFGPAAAALAAIALVLGLLILLLARRLRRGVGLAIAAHGTVAVTAFVLLLAYLSLG